MQALSLDLHQQGVFQAIVCMEQWHQRFHHNLQKIAMEDCIGTALSRVVDAMVPVHSTPMRLWGPEGLTHALL